MAYIQIDSRGCGVGKTRNTIIPRIRNNLWNGIKTLVVVPSINLQKEYARYFVNEDFTVINCENFSKESVFTQYQTADTPIICITHQAFERIPSSVFDKTKTDLIIDEVLNPYKSQTVVNYDSAGHVWLNLGDLFKWKSLVIGKYREIEITKNTPPNLIDKNYWNNLVNENYELFISHTAGENFMKNQSEKTEIFQSLKPNVLQGWASVWIAAAAFEDTFMGYWLNTTNLDYQIQYAFERHKKQAVWHIPSCESSEFTWTKTQRNENTIKIFNEYCDKHRTGRVIYNENKDYEFPRLWGKRINHNAHGVNEYSSYKDYAYISAINPNNNFKSFIQSHCGIESYVRGTAQVFKSLRSSTLYDPFKFAFSTYNAYQLLMRTALRDPNNTVPVNGFFLDQIIAFDLMSLFDPRMQETKSDIPLTSNKPNTRGQGRKPAMTPAEKQKLYRLRKKTQTDS